MPDSWLTDEEKEQFEEEVKNHPLTKQAEAIEAQKDDLEKLAKERKEQYEEEGGIDREDTPYHGQPEEVYAEQSNPSVTEEKADPRKATAKKAKIEVKPGAEKSENDDAKTGGPSV